MGVDIRGRDCLRRVAFQKLFHPGPTVFLGFGVDGCRLGLRISGVGFWRLG